MQWYNIRQKVKFNLENATKAQRGKRYICTLSLTSVLDGVGGQRPVSAALPRERPSTHCIGGWVGPRVCPDAFGKSRTHWDSIPGPFSSYRSCYTDYPIPAPIPYKKYFIFVGTLANTILHAKGSGNVITYSSTAARWTNTGSISDRTKRVSSSSQRPQQIWAHLVSEVMGIWAYLIGEEAVKMSISLNLSCISGLP
jgi:hypothetical protein